MIRRMLSMHLWALLTIAAFPVGLLLARFVLQSSWHASVTAGIVAVAASLFSRCWEWVDDVLIEIRSVRRSPSDGLGRAAEPHDELPAPAPRSKR
jgi:hypothetical protein